MEPARAGLRSARRQLRELAQPAPRLGRLHDLLDEKSLRRTERRTQALEARADLALGGFRIGRRLDLRLECSLEPALDRQRAPVAARPRDAIAEAGVVDHAGARDA